MLYVGVGCFLTCLPVSMLSNLFLLLIRCIDCGIMGKDIVIDEEITSFAVNEDVVHVKAGNWEFLVRDPPLAVSYRTPRKTAYIIGGVIMLLIGLFFMSWYVILLSYGYSGYAAASASIMFFFGAVFVAIGVILLVIGSRTKAVVSIESRTGTVVSVRANPYIAHNLIEDMLKKQTIQAE